ncbi:MAG TPA: alpha/beta hydrolase [Gemmatimonadales bacterium]|nr:alpha/beta hydrolase [Gemmatimonadales bacterium]
MRPIYLVCVLAACGGGSPPPPATPAAGPGGPQARAVVTLRAAQVNGTTLAYRLLGDSGTPVVFVHGSLGDLGDWDAQVAAFAGTHRVLVYSRRYHPPNPPQNDDQAYSPALHAEDLAALLLALDLAPAHVVGAGYGGYTALVLGLEHPELVRSLVLGEPPIMPLLNRTPEADAIRRAFFAAALDPARAAFAHRDSVAALRAFFNGVNSPDRFDNLPAPARAKIVAHAFEMRREMLANREEYMPPLPCADLGRLHTPVLLLSADRSARLFHAITDELARCLRSDSTATIPGAGHAMQAANPASYNRTVLRYLATH